jgi:hypothetical protein
MRPVSAKFVPCLHTEEQKDNCVNVSRDLKEELHNDPNFLTKIVTGMSLGAMRKTQKQNKHQASGNIQIH